MIRFVLLGFVVLCIFSSCTSRYYMRRGNLMHESGRYHKAGANYIRAFNKTSEPELQALVAMRVGQSFQDINKLPDAYGWYRRASREDKTLKDAYLKMAEMSIGRGNLDAAAETYHDFDRLFPDDTRGKDGLYQLELLRNEMGEQGRYVVEILKELNSRESDFAPLYYPADNSFLYFTSTRRVKGGKKRNFDPVTGQAYSNLFVAEFTQEVRKKNKRGVVQVTRHYPEPRWLPPVPVQDSVLSPKNDGAATFDAEGTVLYFTSSRPIDGKNVGTRIYQATQGKKQHDEERENASPLWSIVTKSGICGDTVSIGHPALTPDGRRLYFVTDMLPHGKGGKDIWYVEKTGDKWGDPVNAGDVINSVGNEMYPYVRDNSALYFASDGHHGLGGLDLYKVIDNEEEQHIEHLPVPVNSVADDFGISFKNSREEGIFSSSRLNRSDDLYTFTYVYQQLNLRLLVTNSITERGIQGVDVLAVSDNGERIELVTDSVGYIMLPLAADNEYVFTASHNDYLKAKTEVSTYREKGDRLYDIVLVLQPIEKPIVIPNIYFNVAKWDLREDAIRNLQELLTILKDNPNITIELSAHTDMIGNDAANMLLSDKRATAVVDYLISQGIYWDRLVAKGYGKTRPRTITERDAKTYSFLKEGDLLDSRFIGRLKGKERDQALQLNRRIEFKVLTTNYKPGENSMVNPNRKALSAEDVNKMGETTLKTLKSVEGHFFTLQLGVFRNVPPTIRNFKVVFTEKLNNGTVRYCTGIYETRAEAQAASNDLKKRGIDNIIKEYK